jgi:hypothetical protein
MNHLLFTFIQNTFIRFLFLIILFRFDIIQIQINFFRLMNFFTKFQIVSAEGLGLNEFLFLHIIRFIPCSKDLVKLAAG